MKKDILDDNFVAVAEGDFLLRDEKIIKAEELVLKISPFSIFFFFCFDWILFKDNSFQLIFWGVLFSLAVSIPLMLVLRWRKIALNLDVNDEQSNPFFRVGFSLHRMLTLLSAFVIFAPGLNLVFNWLTYLELFLGLCLTAIGAIYFYFPILTFDQAAKLNDYREELKKKNRQW